MSDDILIARGVRQGDPLSALLYVTIAEVLRNLIRSNKDINGITINSIEQKILQYAEDSQIIVTNDKSINEVFQQLRLYEDATGANVNVQETEGLFMGKWKTDMTNHLIVNGQLIKFLPWDYGLEIRAHQKLSLQNN